MHTKAEMKVWQGRVDDEGPRALRWHQCVKALEEGGARGMALLGFACDAGVRRNHGRPGAAGGPLVIRQILAGQPWHAACPVYDAGDVICQGDALEATQEALSVAVEKLLGEQHFPIVLGGGHEVAWGSFQGLARHLARQPGHVQLGIINFDAHLDMRLSQEPSSGTPFAQIARECAARGWPFNYLCVGMAETANTNGLIDSAKASGAQIIRDEEVQPWVLASALDRVQAFVNACDLIYLSIDIDVMPANQAPGVSAPAAYGVPLASLEGLIDCIRNSGKLRLVDLAEFNPDFDQQNLTARSIARLIYRLVR